MNHDCNQAATILKIQETQNAQAIDVGIIKDVSLRMQQSIASFILESRQLIQEVRDRGLRDESGLRDARKDIEILFQQDKETAQELLRVEQSIKKELIGPIDTRVRSLEDWRVVAEGKKSVWREMGVVIPVVCTLIATGIVLWQAFSEGK